MKDADAHGGRVLTAAEIVSIEAQLDLALPMRIVKHLTELPLVGVEFILSPTGDSSGLGVALRWMTPDEMVSEALEAYPGRVAVPLGYLPVGICLEGSGDPYFVRLHDLALVRVPHEAARGGELEISSVECVTASLEEFLQGARRYQADD